MEGWRREMFADETGLPWVMPSPNMPTLDTAVVYPGTVLFEGTLLSEGRGTTRPFELLGAPGIEAERFAREMNALGLPGAFFRPAVFEPTFQKHAKQTCGGCQVHVTDRRAFKPVLTGAALIAMFHRAAPGAAALAPAAVRVRTRQAADRHPRGIAAVPRADRSGNERRRAWPSSWPRTSARSAPCARRTCSTETREPGRQPGLLRLRRRLVGREHVGARDVRREDVDALLEAPALRRLHVDVLVAAHVAGVRAVAR